MLPIQSFNGYSAPWAGGAGKNMLQNTMSETGTYAGNVSWTKSTDGSFELTGSNTQNLAQLKLIGSVALEAGTSYTISGLPADTPVGVWIAVYEPEATSPVSETADTGSGRVFTVETTATYDIKLRVISGGDVTGVTVRPMVCLSSATDPLVFNPWENICPISGHTSATLVRTGKNLLPNVATSQSGDVTFTVNDDGTITTSGTATADVTFNVAAKPTISKALNGLGGQSVVCSGCPSGGNLNTYRMAFGRINGTNVSSETGSGVTLTVSDNLEAVSGSVYVNINISSGTVCDGLVFKPMIRLASDTDDTYEQYQGKTYTTSFGSTVYGGTLDFTTGVLTATVACASFDGTESWSLNGSGDTVFFRTVRDGAVKTVMNDFANKICSHFTSAVIFSSNTDKGYSAYTSSLSPEKAWLQFRPDSSIASTVEEWKAYLAAQYTAGTPVQCTYPLATPQTIQLTAQEITTLQGTNNVWAYSST